MTVINACGHFLHADPNNTIPTPGTICDLIRMIIKPLITSLLINFSHYL